MPADWVQAAVALPVAFAQVREDPRLDLEVVASLNATPRIAMIASGGETALCLGRLPLGQLALIDVNPAQLALVRCKWWLAQHATPREAREWLGHELLSAEERGQRVAETLEALALGRDSLGPFALVSSEGADHCGRYERLFAALRQALQHQSLEAAFTDTMALDNLVALFGEAATQNPRQSFADHFLARTRLALQRPDAKANPFLQRILTGGGPDWDWLQGWERPRIQPEWHRGEMSQVLEQWPPAQFDLVHLSNILDWLSEAEASLLLERAARALRPGGRVLVRQLNSSLDIPRLSSPFAWDESAGARLVERDRSFFYPSIHLGRKL